MRLIRVKGLAKLILHKGLILNYRALIFCWCYSAVSN